MKHPERPSRGPRLATISAGTRSSLTSPLESAAPYVSGRTLSNWPDYGGCKVVLCLSQQRRCGRAHHLGGHRRGVVGGILVEHIADGGAECEIEQRTGLRIRICGHHEYQIVGARTIVQGETDIAGDTAVVPPDSAARRSHRVNPQ